MRVRIRRFGQLNEAELRIGQFLIPVDLVTASRPWYLPNTFSVYFCTWSGPARFRLSSPFPVSLLPTSRPSGPSPCEQVSLLALDGRYSIDYYGLC
jgi:hypothetical protein